MVQPNGWYSRIPDACELARHVLPAISRGTCTHRPVACSLDYFTPLLSSTAERPVFPILNRSRSVRSQTQLQTNAQPRQAYYTRIYNTSEAHQGNLLGAVRDHFYTSPSPPVSSTSPEYLPSVGTCHQHRTAVAISGPSRYIEA